MYQLGEIVGSIFLIGFLARIISFLSVKFLKAKPRAVGTLIAGDVLAWAFSTATGSYGLGSADRALIAYTPALALWVLIDIVRVIARKTSNESTSSAEPIKPRSDSVTNEAKSQDIQSASQDGVDKGATAAIPLPVGGNDSSHSGKMMQLVAGILALTVMTAIAVIYDLNRQQQATGTGITAETKLISTKMIQGTRDIKNDNVNYHYQGVMTSRTVVLGQAFGASIVWKSTRATVHYRVSLTGPASLRHFHPSGGDVSYSTDGRTVFVDSYVGTGQHEKSYLFSIDEGDPLGAYVFSVDLDGVTVVRETITATPSDARRQESALGTTTLAAASPRPSRNENAVVQTGIIDHANTGLCPVDPVNAPNPNGYALAVINSLAQANLAAKTLSKRAKAEAEENVIANYLVANQHLNCAMMIIEPYTTGKDETISTSSQSMITNLYQLRRIYEDDAKWSKDVLNGEADLRAGTLAERKGKMLIARSDAMNGVVSASTLITFALVDPIADVKTNQMSHLLITQAEKIELLNNLKLKFGTLKKQNSYADQAAAMILKFLSQKWICADPV